MSDQTNLQPPTPPSLPEKYCVATITCDKFSIGTEVLLYSFLKYNPWFNGDINIVIADLAPHSRQRLKSIYPVNFVAASNQLTKKIEVLTSHLEHLKDIHLRFYSLEAFNMTDYEKVVYLDSDIYCSGDVKELFTTDEPLVACLDGFSYEYKAMLMLKQVGMTLPITDTRYGKVFKDSFNTGVFALSPPILSKTHYERLVDMIDYEAWMALGSWAFAKFTDQMILNRYFEGMFSTISSKYNYMVFLGDYMKYIGNVSFQEATLIHFAGKIKPWNNYLKEDILKIAPHYLKYIEIWREFLYDLRNEKNYQARAQRLLDQYNWIENGNDQQLMVQGGCIDPYSEVK